MHAPFVLLLGLVLVASGVRGDVPGFTSVGDLPGGAVGSTALAVSTDGTTVVGRSEGGSGPEAYRWTSGSGIVGLGFLSPAEPWSTARAVSDDGSVIAGSSHDAAGVPRAFRWSAGSMTALDRFVCNSCDPVSEGLGLSGDGLVVVGSALARGGGSAPVHLDPVRWPAGATAIQDLGDLPASEEVGEAFGASLDGALVAGSHESTDGVDAWYWAGSGLLVLPRLFGGTPVAAAAFAISRDASTVVGYSTQATLTLPGGSIVPTEPQAVRWTGAGFGSVEALGSLPGATLVDSRALAVSADGAVIVGRAVDENGSERAFLWDAAGGMRKLETVLALDYGLDVSGWVLSEALGVSEVVDGSFTVVGNGVDPQGDLAGWVATLSPPACSDGEDDDSDGDIDHPDDPGCRSPADASEEFDCSDGLDNDGDGDLDHPADAGCRSADDPSEEPDCSDALDNDGDGLVDHPADPGCFDAQGSLEDPECSDGLDNDGDGDTDHPDDAQCVRPSDRSEVADCSDGLDNDGDGLVDHPADPECEASTDLSENAQCSDGVDNDGDGRTDYPGQYPGCLGFDDPSEAPQCSDGEDNDGDGSTDHPDDPGCSAPADENEDPFVPAAAGLLVVDRSSRALFFVDPATGAQTPISEGALLQAPQGVVPGAGELWVADPAGLVAVSFSGSQRPASPPLAEGDSLQVVVDGAGAPFVLEASRISRVDGASGMGSITPWLSLPVFPTLLGWEGDSLAIDLDGDFLVTGLGFNGNGVMRVDAVTQDVTVLDPAMKARVWNDLALEADGTILAVGSDPQLGAGVYRVDPVDGLHTRLDDTHPFQFPTGVALDPGGEIFVADAGLCAENGACTGGEIVRVSPLDGTAVVLSSGGLIAGEMDVAWLPEPGRFAGLVAGVGALAWLGDRRRRARSRARR